MTPNIEERLAAAAYSILTDGRRHSYQAERWALRFLHSIGGASTAFFREVSHA